MNWVVPIAVLGLVIAALVSALLLVSPETYVRAMRAIGATARFRKAEEVESIPVPTPSKGVTAIMLLILILMIAGMLSTFFK